MTNFIIISFFAYFNTLIHVNFISNCFQELQRLEDEELMNECIDAMLDDELEEQINEWEKVKNEELSAALSSLAVSDCNVTNSLLNPLAAEFIPQSHLIIDLGSS